MHVRACAAVHTCICWKFLGNFCSYYAYNQTVNCGCPQLNGFALLRAHSRPSYLVDCASSTVVTAAKDPRREVSAGARDMCRVGQNHTYIRCMVYIRYFLARGSQI